jgi:hypothetical protein
MLEIIGLVLVRVDCVVQVEVQLNRNIRVDLHSVIIRTEIVLNVHLQLLGRIGVRVILLRKTLLGFIHHILNVILLL